MTKPSSAAYQAYRKNTLRGLEREKIRSVGLELLRFNQRTKRKHYRKAQIEALKGRAA